MSTGLESPIIQQEWFCQPDRDTPLAASDNPTPGPSSAIVWKSMGRVRGTCQLLDPGHWKCFSIAPLVSVVYLARESLLQCWFTWSWLIPSSLQCVSKSACFHFHVLIPRLTICPQALRRPVPGLLSWSPPWPCKVLRNVPFFSTTFINKVFFYNFGGGPSCSLQGEGCFWNK